MWEYRTIDLNSLPRKKSAEDLLNEAGQDGWELVTVSRLGIGIFKRPVPQPKQPKTRRSV